MAGELFPVGPFPEGSDNVHDPHSSVFQPSDERLPRLVIAQDCDLDDDGFPSKRVGNTEVVTGTAFKDGVSLAGLILLQDGGTIVKLTLPSTKATLVSGLSSSLKVHFAEFGGDIFWTNNATRGKVVAGADTHWGMDVPPVPTLGTTSGSLAAGNYLVAVTYLDADGAESGADQVGTVTLTNGQAITVEFTLNDSNATHVNVYVSEANQKDVFWCKKVAVAATVTTTISTVGVSKRPLRTQFMTPPVVGSGIATYLGYVITWADELLSISMGETPNLFLPEQDVFQYAWDVQSVIGLQDGFYVATSKTLNWVTQESEDVWVNTEVDQGVYAAGSLIIPGEKIPQLQTSALVGLLASDDGLVACKPGGVIQKLTDGRLDLDTAASTAHINYRETDDLRQILMLLT